MPKGNLLQSLVGKADSEAGPLDRHETTMDPIGRVVPDARRCVQCGVCSYNCPLGIPVREYAHQGLPVKNTVCITCGQCIEVCPRGTLRWETLSHALVADPSLCKSLDQTPFDR